MDSLLASYASSDEEDERPQPPQISSSSRPKSAIFSALPPPKSYGEAFSFCQPKGAVESREASTTSSLFSSLPQPKTLSDVNPVEKQHPPHNSSSSRAKSALFSALPPPKSSGEATLISTALPQPKASPGPNPDLNPKKVVQFRPPTLPVRSANPTTSEDEEDGEEQDSKTRKQSTSVAEAPSVKSFLSSMPAARYSSTLGVSGSGRRSIIDTQVPDPAPDELGAPNDSAVPQDAGGASSVSFSVQTGTNYEQGTAYGSYDHGVDYNGGNYGTYHVGGDPSSGYASYENYNGQYENNWADQAGNVLPDSSCSLKIPVELPRKRGRKDIPTEILEVKQDDLMKNRPREDQVKLTGIAFGPAYQPASTKGKPSKLHKRKHQIGSLFFDMKQKEMELAERRSRGFLTKAETQAKYGW